MSHLPAFTIASNNYLAFAKVLASSYQEHHPGAPVFVCIVDRPDPSIDYGRLPFTVIFAQDLAVPNFRCFAFRYDILELNTAVKPYVLTHLRDHYDFESVLYFDPDILIQDTLTGIEEALEDHCAVLTPHVTRPLDNAYDPAERKILVTGVYNLGFLGIRYDDTAGFLEWWKDRLYKYCVVDLHHGLFVDQSWMNLAPAYLETLGILHDPIYNVAYWNLPHRHPQQIESHWYIEGRRVGFFHFSGLRLDDLDAVSRHQTRLVPGERPELRPLFEEYRDRIMAAGHSRLSAIPYGFGRFKSTQTEIPPVARRLLQRVDPDGRRWRDPFDPDGVDSFLTWLTEPLELPLGYLNRTVLTYWENRYDLVREFTDPGGKDLARYVAWIDSHHEIGQDILPAPFLEGVRIKQVVPAIFSFAPQVPPFEAGYVEEALEILKSVDLERPASLLLWLNDPAPGARLRQPIITRLAMLLHSVREDLQKDFPDPLGRDQLPFAYWFCAVGGNEFRLAPELVEPVRRSLPWRSRLSLLLRTRRAGTRPATSSAETLPASPSYAEALSDPKNETAAETVAELESTGPPRARATSGVNMVGFFEKGSTMERLCRGNLEALCQAGIEVATAPLDRDILGGTVGGRINPPQGIPYSVTLLQVDVERTGDALSMLPSACVSDGTRIGYWFWDLAHLPMAWAHFFSHFDEVWAPSQFCSSSFQSLADVPVRWMPPCVPVPSGGKPDREACGLDSNTFYFFAHLDARGLAETTNPFAAVEVIRRLHQRGSAPAALLLKVDHAASDPRLVAALREKAGDLPVRIDTATDRSAEELQAACDGYLSLHRAGSLEVSAIQALHLGKPAVATAYGGVTDFLDESTGFPVGYKLTRLPDHLGPYPAGAVWAEPDLGQAVELAERLLKDREKAADRAAAGKRRVGEIYGIKAAAERFRHELSRKFRY